MASAVIHICVAKKVNEYLKFREKELFLGTIAPDISKEINQTKVKSHFLSNIEDVPDINLFLHKYENKLKTPFDYGYFIHLYTDKLWYSNLMTDIVGKTGSALLKDKGLKNDKEAARDLFYNDYTNMNIKLIDKYNLDLTLFYEDFEIPNTCIKEVPVRKLDILIDKMGIIIANSHNRRNRVLDYNKVITFIDDTASEIIKYLKDNNL